MSKGKPLPSLERLAELFELDCGEGKLFWRERRQEEFTSERLYLAWNAKYQGKEVGHLDKQGYRQTKIDGKHWFVHRIIFSLANEKVVGEEEEIDHWDRDKGNNRPGNLRIATVSQNAWNRKCRKNSTFALKGVRPERRCLRYRARIMINGKNIHLGMFKTPGEAHAAYAKASRELHGEFGRAA